MKRLFAAVKIEPDENFIRIFTALKAGLAGEAIRWSAVDNMHVTLKFFGETHDNIIPDICSALQKVKPGVHDFELRITGTGMFGSRYKPRVIWFGLEGIEPLQIMAARLNENIVPLGYPADRQNFVPHLTAGRMNSIRDKQHFQKVLDAFKVVKLQTVSVKTFHLYESVLYKSGPVYHVIETFTF
ncbi:MAG: RNA 2',3'-cyclic phosphodiesterase [Bacteroidota bacterium]